MSNTTSRDTTPAQDAAEPSGTGSDSSAEPAPAPTKKNPLLAALRDKNMRAPLFWSVIGRFPLSLITIALVVFTAARDANYRSTGLVLAGYSLGAAVFAPFVARRVDVYGQPPALLVTGVVYPLALIGFVHAGPRSLALQLVCVVVGGASTPPISGCIRSLWTAAPGMERVGPSLEAVLGEIFGIGGPVLLSMVLIWGSPGAALVLGGLLSGVGAIGFAATRASRARRVTRSERDPLGALRSGGLVRLLIVLLCAGAATGVYNVALPAFVENHGSSHGVGLLYAAWGVGGILGGVWYGSRTLRWPVELAFTVGLLVLSAGSALVVLAWDNWSIGAAAVVLGVIEAPVSALSFELIGRAARKSHVTEAFTWAMTVGIAGAAVGAELGGLTINAYGTRTAFIGVVALMLASTAFAFANRHRIPQPAEAA